MNVFANVLTSLSLVSGFFSIILSLENHFTYAAWAILFAVLLDGLDGFIARRNPVFSHFGKEFDSLVDVISFGVAPAVLGYMFVYRDFYLWATLALFIYLACSVIRLAMYNITPHEDMAEYFYGLPITASGGIVASFILIYRKYAQLAPSRFFLILILTLAFLMVSKIRYANLEQIRIVLNRSVWVFFGVLVLLGVMVCGFYALTRVFLPEIAVLGGFVIYLFSPLFLKKSV